MAEFHNPYHFVPATGRINGEPGPREDFQSIATGKSVHPARHDRFVPGTRSGRLICRVTLERPTMVGADPPDDQGDSDQTSKRVEPYERNTPTPGGDRKTWPALPGSSLRGMVGAVVEALSQSALRVLGDTRYTVRVPPGEGLSALGILEAVGDDESGRKFDLRPVGLPTVRSESATLQLPRRWQRAFGGAHGCWNDILTAYVDGYTRTGNRGEELSARRSGFLGKQFPDSFRADRPVYYYALLESMPDSPLSKPLRSSDPALRIKDARQGRLHFLLGRRLREILTHGEWLTLHEDQARHYTRGYLRVLGIEGRETEIPPTKRHEIFIPAPPERIQAATLPVPVKVTETFRRIARARFAVSKGEHPFALQGVRDDGDEEPWAPRVGDLVFFDVDEQGERVTEISVSAIWRRERPDGTYAFFDAIQPDLTPMRQKGGVDGRERRHLTPAELLLGVVDEDKAKGVKQGRALASRVRFHDALAVTKPRRARSEITLRTLASPKPPSPAMYFHPKSGWIADQAPVHKTQLSAAEHRPNGRKVYLHHPPFPTKTRHWPCRSQANDDRDHLRLRCSPLLAGEDQRFFFHIDFDNLGDAELSLLLCALSPDATYRHKLGLGKPLGLGTVRIDLEGIFLVDRERRYGPDALAQPRYHQVWYPREAAPPEWAHLYPREAASLTARDGGVLTERIAATGVRDLEVWNDDLIDRETLSILVTLGDPDKLLDGVEVHTPITLGQWNGSPENKEKETFKWFVGNEKLGNQGEALTPVVAGESLPTLRYLPDRD